MAKTRVFLLLVWLPWIPVVAAGQTPQSSSVASIPQYKVSFVRGKATPGLTGSHAFKLPLQCTSDGTVFVSFVSTVPANAGLPPPPPGILLTELTAIPREGAGRTFPTDRIPELYVSGERDHFANDSGVAILVTASQENKPVEYSYKVGNYQGEAIRNAAEQHTYLLTFTRDGEFRHASELSESFYIEHIGVFSSGDLLVFGFDKKDHSPRLVMLKQDGTLLKSMEFSKDQIPESMINQAKGALPHSIAPSELVAVGQSIFLVQNQSRYPLLEITEGGAIRALSPKLPEGEQVEGLIPSDHDLYVIASAEGKSEAQQLIYEVNSSDGTLVKRFFLSDGDRASDSVACVNDGKFLSIEYGNGEVIPLTGSPEPVSSTEKLKEPKR